MLALNQNAFISHIPFAIYHEMSNKTNFTNKDYEDTSAGFGIITVLIIEHCRKNLCRYTAQQLMKRWERSLLAYLKCLINNLFHYAMISGLIIQEMQYTTLKKIDRKKENQNTGRKM